MFFVLIEISKPFALSKPPLTYGGLITPVPEYSAVWPNKNAGSAAWNKKFLELLRQKSTEDSMRPLNKEKSKPTLDWMAVSQVKLGLAILSIAKPVPCPVITAFKAEPYR